MNRYEKFITNIGFTNVQEITSAKHADKTDQLRAFTYEGFDPQAVKNSIGKPKDNAGSLLIWSGSRNKALRVDSERNHILLGNGKKAVRALFASVAARKE